MAGSVVLDPRLANAGHWLAAMEAAPSARPRAALEAALASGPQTDLKVMATGLAAGILLDATVIRALLVPAVVSLFGRWNWWLPAWPARLLRVEPSLPREVAAARE